MNSKTDINQQEFLVRESKTVNFVFAGLLLVVCVVSFSFGGLGWGRVLFTLLILLVPAVLLLIRGNANKISIRINHLGFFYQGKLVTSWEMFYDVKLYEKPAFARINDQFYILIRYHKPNSADLFGRKIPMSNTQDKADEEIIAAVRTFYQRWEQQRHHR